MVGEEGIGESVAWEEELGGKGPRAGGKLHRYFKELGGYVIGSGGDK